MSVSAVFGSAEPGLFSHPLFLLAMFAAMALVPFAALALTSYLKLSVVFGIVRNAVGASQFPSSAVVALVSLALTVVIMKPVCAEILTEVEQVLDGAREQSISGASQEKGAEEGRALSAKQLGAALEVGRRAKEPLKRFLIKHSHPRERVFFAQLSSTKKNTALTKESIQKSLRCEKRGDDVHCEPEGESIASLIPAFVISELGEAFAIGFTLFLPFLVIDLVVANLLVGLGMMMVSPVSISLPFKLILFVVCDGWFLLSRSMVLSYM